MGNPGSYQTLAGEASYNPVSNDSGEPHDREQGTANVPDPRGCFPRVWQFQNKTFPSNQTPWASCDLPLGSAGPGSSFFSRLPTAERKQG